jgi:hypothetical protein
MLENSIQSISDALSQLYKMLVESIVPALKSIQENQTDQRQQTEWLTQNLEDFRVEMQAQFALLHAEMASARGQLEDAMAVLNAQKAAASLGIKPTIH